MKLADAVKQAVDASVAAGGRKTTGPRLRDAIDNKVYYYFKTLKRPTLSRPARSLDDYIRNAVNARLHEIKNAATKGEVSRQAEASIKASKPFTGSVRKARGWVQHSGNILARIGEDITVGSAVANPDATPLLFDSEQSQKVPADKAVWRLGLDQYACIEGTLYRETTNNGLDPVKGIGPQPSDLSVDLSPHLKPLTLWGNVSYRGHTVTQTWQASEVVKVLAYGKYRLILLATRYQHYDATMVDLWETVVQDLVILNAVDGSSVLLGPDHTNWNSLGLQTGIVAGYLDIQISLKNNKLLVLKTADAPVDAVMPVSYYGSDSGAPVFTETQDMVIHTVPHYLDEMTLAADGQSLELSVSLYSEASPITSMFGLDVYGGYRCAMFTQQPTTNKLFILRHFQVARQDPASNYMVYTAAMWEVYDVDSVSPILQLYAKGGGILDVYDGYATYGVHSYLGELTHDDIGSTNDFYTKFIPALDSMAVAGSIQNFGNSWEAFSGHGQAETAIGRFTDINGTFEVDTALEYSPTSGLATHENRFVALYDPVSGNTYFTWFTDFFYYDGSVYRPSKGWFLFGAGVALTNLNTALGLPSVVYATIADQVDLNDFYNYWAGFNATTLLLGSNQLLCTLNMSTALLHMNKVGGGYEGETPATLNYYLYHFLITLTDDTLSVSQVQLTPGNQMKLLNLDYKE